MGQDSSNVAQLSPATKRCYRCETAKLVEGFCRKLSSYSYGEPKSGRKEKLVS